MKVMVCLTNMVFQREPSSARWSCGVCFEGTAVLYDRPLEIPFGASYADILTLARGLAIATAAEVGVAMASDDPVQVFGAPAPTIAELGG